MDMATEHFQVAIIGTGFSGLGMAIRLKQTGTNNFVILERADDIGGTWRDNTYPGCACDIPSHLYSFSFALNPNWSRVFSPQKEIWAYLRQCAERFGIIPHIRWNSPLEQAAWDDTAQQWQISTPQGKLTAKVLVVGSGPLSEPSWPNIKGLADFKGKLFHSARWDHEYDLRGKRVAVIGTGASAIQFVPQIQPEVSRLVLFQRTPPWIVPRQDHDIPVWQRNLYRLLPLAQRLVRGIIYCQREIIALGLVYQPARVKEFEKLACKYLEKQVPDPGLRAKLIPDYSLGCKRILLSDDYYPALTQPNVQLVTEHIQEIRPDSIVTGDGTEYPVDAIICGTGFHATDTPVAQLIRGQEGKLLAEDWAEGSHAYLGTTIAGYPNLFIMIGPNTVLGHNSMVYMIESQISYILEALKIMKDRHLGSIEVQPAAQEHFNATLQSRMKGTVWNSGCKSWYLDKRGHNTTLWPGFTFTFRNLTRHFNPDVYKQTPQKAPIGAASTAAL
jgi:cation diffusion facilitator CzcD-associated flavoprotein CzcO